MLLLISLLVLLAALPVLFKKRFEVLLPPFVCGLILLCYGLALFGKLSWCPYILCALALTALGGVGVGAARKKEWAQLPHRLLAYFFTPGFACFLLLAGVFYAGAMTHFVYHTDDIYYWGIEVRSLFAHGGLVDAVHHYSPRFMTYTPGMQLFQWIGQSILGEWNEGLLFYQLALFYMVFLLPFAQRISWKKAYWIPVFLLFAILLPLLFNGNAYSMLRVDTALGICLGYALMQVWSLRGGQNTTFHLVCLALSLSVLLLVKQIGMMWALVALGLFFVVRPRKQPGVKLLPLLLSIALPVLVCASWFVFCQGKQLSGVHVRQTSTGFASLLQGTWTPPPGFALLPSTIWQALTVPIRSHSDMGFQILEVPKIYWMLAFMALPMLLCWLQGRSRREMGRLTLWVVGCMALFLLSFGVSFMTTFYPETEGFTGEHWISMHFLLERYAAPLWIGMAVLLGFLWQEQSPAGGRSHTPYRLAGACVALVLLLSSPWGNLFQNLLPENYLASNPSPEERYIFEAENGWVSDLEAPEDAIVLYGVEPYPFKGELLQYALMPAKLLYIFGDISQEEFTAKLQYDQVTHLVCMDENNTVYENALPFTEDEWLECNTVYTVNWEDGTPLISY